MPIAVRGNQELIIKTNNDNDNDDQINKRMISAPRNNQLAQKPKLIFYSAFGFSATLRIISHNIGE